MQTASSLLVLILKLDITSAEVVLMKQSRMKEPQETWNVRWQMIENLCKQYADDIQKDTRNLIQTVETGREFMHREY